MVTQDIQLFHASVARQPDTLRQADPRCASSRRAGRGWAVHLVARTARRPGHAIERSDSNLSAGEAQLLAFARAFLIDPGLVILDEASSRLSTRPPSSGSRPR
ncbi:MAG: ATP-binding cassette domain-containing protein [Caldilineaceae bacterium]